MSTYFEKSQHPDRKGEGGVNPYGQPDSKKTVLFDEFPYRVIRYFFLESLQKSL